MPFPPQLLNNLAQAGTNIIVDASIDAAAEIMAVVNLWSKGTGNVTIRRASLIPPNTLVGFASALRNRLTLEE